MTWDGIVTKYHKSHLKRLEIPKLLKKTVETISFDRRRGLETSMGVIMRVGMHEKPTPTLKQAIREEDGAKNLKTKNNRTLISKNGNVLE
ncbi:hypothetical protein CWI39_0354p0010 [Hamiltosporidium magnivora]|uniref:Uncharacterized protein n=1 Tax=Hamiltosporidium magnivora TaxID=148818 RepID=A0A4Q9LJG0_9MICR|nr:hypothetical protein CWI39_0354p0010 [Hamiltosporidium magnivora]